MPVKNSPKDDSISYGIVFFWLEYKYSSLRSWWSACTFLVSTYYAWLHRKCRLVVSHFLKWCNLRSTSIPLEDEDHLSYFQTVKDHAQIQRLDSGATGMCKEISLRFQSQVTMLYVIFPAFCLDTNGLDNDNLEDSSETCNFVIICVWLQFSKFRWRNFVFLAILGLQSKLRDKIHCADGKNMTVRFTQSFLKQVQAKSIILK